MHFVKVTSLFHVTREFFLNIFQYFFCLHKIWKLKKPVVCILGGGRTPKEVDRDTLYHLAKNLVEQNASILTISSKGVSEVVNCGAVAVGKGARNLSILVKDFNDEKSECAQNTAVLKFFGDRQWLVMHYSDSFIIFPGGCEVVTYFTQILMLVQIKHMVSKPVFLIDEKFWAPLIRWIELAIKSGLVAKSSFDLFRIITQINNNATAMLQTICNTESCNAVVKRKEICTISKSIFYSLSDIINCVALGKKLKRPIISIFGGVSVLKNDASYKKAYELSKKLVEQNMTVLTGGGPGIMEAANCGAATRKDGIWSVGLGVMNLLDEKANECAQDEVAIKYFYSRKWFLMATNAFVAFPGGFGTLNEIAHVVMMMQKKQILKAPVILVDKSYWCDILLLLKNISSIDQNDDSALEIISVVDDIGDAFSIIKNFFATKK